MTDNGHPLLRCLWAVAIVVGCQSPAHVGICDEETDGGAIIEGPKESHEEDGPRVIQVELDPSEMGESGSAEVTAEVCHPLGVEHIESAHVARADTGLVFADLERVKGSALFRATLEWERMHELDPIEFYGAWKPLMLRIETEDSDGRAGWREAELRLVCEGAGVCDGVCKEVFRDPDNCGVCGLRCDVQDQPRFEEACVEGKCTPVFTPCFERNPEHAVGCNTACGSLTEDCVDRGCWGATAMYYDDLEQCEAFAFGQPDTSSCNWQVGIPSASYVRCCCTDTQ